MAHAAAVAHYTEMARQAANMAALRAGQARFETAPELPDDDTLTADEAQSQAEDEMLTTAEPLADWIAKRCDNDQGRGPINTTRFADVDLIDCDRVPVLLACLLAGDFAQMKAASCRLRTLYLKAERKAVQARAAELQGGAL